MLDTVKNAPVNGLDLAALGEVVEAIEKDASQGQGRLRGDHPLEGPDPQRDHRRRLHAGRRAHQRAATRSSPTSRASCSGSDSAPNPQELLMAAFNACITVGYVAGAALEGHQRSTRSRSRPAASSTCAASSASATPSRRATRTSIMKSHQGRRFARGFRGNPPDGDEDVAQLLQHEPADQNERHRFASADATLGATPSCVAPTLLKRGAEEDHGRSRHSKDQSEQGPLGKGRFHPDRRNDA